MVPHVAGLDLLLAGQGVPLVLLGPLQHCPGCLPNVPHFLARGLVQEAGVGVDH